MQKYLLDHYRYANLVRRCAEINEDYPHENTLDILLDLLHVEYDHKSCFFEVPTKLMQKITIANLCDIALLQLRDTHGEIDYAGLNESSRSVLLDIIYMRL